MLKNIVALISISDNLEVEMEEIGMDLQTFFKKYWWVGLLALYLVSVGIKYKAEGINGFLTAAGISLITAIIQTLINNSRIIKKAFRMLKYFLGFGTFVWDTRANFLVNDIERLSNEEGTLEKIIKDVLARYDIKIKSRDELDISNDKLGRLKIFVQAYSVYINIDTTDAEMQDNEGNSLKYLNIRVRTSLRYRNTRKIITGFLLDFFDALDRRYAPLEQKYSMKVHVEGMSKNFFKEQFIKEFKPDEVQSFSIMVKNPRANHEVTHSQFSVTTNRRDELMNSVSQLILRLS